MNAAVGQWSRRALLLLLVAAFVQPACMTTMLWRDDWSTPVIESSDARTTVRRGTPTGGDDDAAEACFVAVDDELRALLPAYARESAWLKLVPREHAYTVAMLLAARSVDAFPLQVVFTATPDGGLTASLACWLQSYERMPDAMLRELPGFELHFGLYSSYRFATGCRWEPVPKGLPAPQGWEAELWRKCIRESPELTEGRSLTARVLWTPVTVLGDVLLSPFELIAWLQI